MGKWSGKRMFVSPFEKGKCIISGTVKEIKPDGVQTVVSVVNRVPMPATKADRLAVLHLSFPGATVERMRLKPGSVIAAAVDTCEEINLFLEGGECGVTEFRLQGHSLKYTGEFLSENGNVLAGTVINKVRTKDVVFYTVKIRVGKEDVRRKVGVWGEEGAYAVPLRSRAIFRIGTYTEDSREKGISFAWAKEVVAM